MKCSNENRTQKKGGMQYVKGKEILVDWGNEWVDSSDGDASICKIYHVEGCRNCPLDFHHHRGCDRPSPVDPGNNSLLLFHWNLFKHGLQTEKGS